MQTCALKDAQSIRKGGREREREREGEGGRKEEENLHLTLFCLSKIRPRPFYPFYIAEQDDKTLTAASMKRDIDY